MSSNVSIWVSAGSLSAPFYSFYTDASGTIKLDEQLIDPSKSYTFYRLNGATSHPFYLKVDPNNTGVAAGFSLSGDGSSSVGITGNQSFTLTFSDPNQAPDSLISYCTAHSSMQSFWSVIGGGTTYTSIESQGSVELQKDSASKIYAKPSSGSSDDITVNGTHVEINTYSGWSPVAAETISGQNKVIWTNNSSGTMVEWNVDSNWNWSNTNFHTAGTTGFFGVETAFQMDFNNDGVIGAPGATYTSIELQGSVELQKDSAGMIYAKPSSGSSDDITVNGTHVAINTYTGWSPVAAETISGQNKVIWTHSSGTMVEWNVDSNWNWSNTNFHTAGTTGFFGVETALQMDFNNDGVIGADVLIGGDDDLRGGNGSDLFHFGKGRDLVHDFNPTKGDQIVIPAEVDINIETICQGVLISDGNGQEMVIRGVDEQTFLASDPFA